MAAAREGHHGHAGPDRHSSQASGGREHRSSTQLAVPAGPVAAAQRSWTRSPASSSPAGPGHQARPRQDHRRAERRRHRVRRRSWPQTPACRSARATAPGTRRRCGSTRRRTTCPSPGPAGLAPSPRRRRRPTLPPGLAGAHDDGACRTGARAGSSCCRPRTGSRPACCRRRPGTALTAAAEVCAARPTTRWPPALDAAGVDAAGARGRREPGRARGLAAGGRAPRAGASSGCSAPTATPGSPRRWPRGWRPRPTTGARVPRSSCSPAPGTCPAPGCSTSSP